MSKPMTFEQVLVNLGKDVRARLPDLTWHVGPEHIAGNAKPRRVVVEPTSDTFTTAPSAPRSRIPGARYIATASVSFHCWGYSFDDAIAIRDAVALTLWKASQGSYQVTGGQWFFDRSIVSQGRVYTLTATIPMAVRDADEGADGKAVEVAGVGGTNEMEFPSGQTVVGCSS